MKHFAELGVALPMDQVRKIVRRALAEDIGAGDITTLTTVSADKQGRGVILAKAEGIIAGLPVAEEVFEKMGTGTYFGGPAAQASESLEKIGSCPHFSALVSEGAKVGPGTEVATISGPLAAILTAERTALNFLMRMSGIATLTAKFVEAVAGTKAQIVDTRKTAPGLRLLDKYAVRVGGGRNHRFGLSDGILIKDNHIVAAGGIREAVARARQGGHHLLKIEVEARTLQEVEEALTAGVEAILLDNMKTAMLAESVKLVAGRALCEASGGITLQNARAVAETGVDLISVGQLTHSAPALDLSLVVSQ